MLLFKYCLAQVLCFTVHQSNFVTKQNVKIKATSVQHKLGIGQFSEEHAVTSLLHLYYDSKWKKSSSKKKGGRRLRCKGRGCLPEMDIGGGRK